MNHGQALLDHNRAAWEWQAREVSDRYRPVDMCPGYAACVWTRKTCRPSSARPDSAPAGSAQGESGKARGVQWTAHVVQVPSFVVSLSVGCV